MEDINQSPGLQEFIGPDGHVFLDSRDEIRTVWSLSYDAFNPLHNKAAGKSTSAGVLVMLCLSLPPELWYKQENIFLVGVVPGPKQPAADGLNPYLRPLVDTLTKCYNEGTCINNLDRSAHAWCPVTQETYRDAAEKWRDATSKSSWAKLYKLNKPDNHTQEEFDFHSDNPLEKSMRRGRAVLTSNPSIAQLLKLSLPVLRALCAENQVVHNSQTTRPKKKQYAMALLSSLNISPQVQIAHEVDTIADELTHLSLDIPESSPLDPFISSSDLLTIHRDIKLTIRPSWKTRPLTNFGTSMHGKLKADEWQACIEFNLPISLMKIWPISNAHDKLHLVCSTFLLSVAIKYATSSSVTPQAIELYSETMLAYLELIRQIRPQIDLHPIHHNTLHLSDFLRQFGPMRGWWMFPIERLIGTLQKLNTNYKSGKVICLIVYLPEDLIWPGLSGELERTMLKSFCAMSQMRVLFQYLAQTEELSQLSEAVKIFDNAFPSVKIYALQESGFTQSTCTMGSGSPAIMDDQIFVKAHSIFPWIMTRSITEFSQCVIRGNIYSVFSGSFGGNSQIFHYSAACQQFIPAIIKSIFVLADDSMYGWDQDRFFLVIHNYTS
ncbi:hypothetical protein NP233_g11574 [Leucocoprinus birnbaumii]|uniref:DUF4218 domain-containing protein n=1 Tax=Leucocoprinus birnbaumii TaxID=56174 RepID=A0AAD5YQU4_9AGAR|nr:hypothetical protein NP233_g11574 [Leucocoprinus birnbaumii]